MKNVQSSKALLEMHARNDAINQGFPTFIWPCTHSAFRQMSMYPKISYGEKAEKNNKNPLDFL